MVFTGDIVQAHTHRAATSVSIELPVVFHTYDVVIRHLLNYPDRLQVPEIEDIE